MRMIMIIMTSITNEDDKKAIVNMGTVDAITNHISAKYMNAQTFIKETLGDIDEDSNPRYAAIAVANMELTINIGKILEGVDMMDQIKNADLATMELRTIMRYRSQKYDGAMLQIRRRELPLDLLKIP